MQKILRKELCKKNNEIKKVFTKKGIWCCAVKYGIVVCVRIFSLYEVWYDVLVSYDGYSLLF